MSVILKPRENSRRRRWPEEREPRLGDDIGRVIDLKEAGGIKPCVSAFIGDQFATQQELLLTRIYGWFYWAINLGAFFGYALIPWLRDRGGYSWAFGVPGIFMALATLIFWLGTKHYVRQPPAGKAGGAGFPGVLWYSLTHAGECRRGQPFLDAALARYDREAVEGAKAVAGILMVFATMPVFWALFNQVNTTWVLQGEKIIPFTVLGYKVDGERIQSISALLFGLGAVGWLITRREK